MPQLARGASLRIRLPYRSEADLVSGLGRNLSPASLFVATEVVRPTGTIAEFQVIYADGRQALSGEAVVAREAPRARPGLLLRFLSLDGQSRALLDRAFATPLEQAERMVLGLDPGTTSTRVALVIEGRPGLVSCGPGEGCSSDEVLRAALTDVQQKLALPATRAVLAVPAFFTERQRAALCERAGRAGWRIERVTSAPAALAIAYAAGRSLPRRRLCVVDFGVSKLDVAIVEVEGDDVEVVACGGDAAFGAASAEHDDRLDRLERVVRSVLVGARLTPKAIDGLVLGGGLAHLADIRQRLSEGLCLTPPDDLEPGSAVAFGAALLGEARADGWQVRDLVPEERAEPSPVRVETAPEVSEARMD